MKVLLGQLTPELGNKKKNVQRIEETVQGGQADLALFGETFLTGYMCRSDFKRLAEPIHGESVRSVSKIAESTGTHIIFGMPELDEKTKVIYNSSVLVSPDGGVQVYRKLHLATFGPFEEGLYFGKGNELSLFETDIGRIGPLICFDSFFPELAKVYALQGADILTVISASPSTSGPMFEKVIPARAVENTVFVLYCNLVGTELNVVFHGGSLVLGPRGDEKAKGKYYEEDVIECEIDLKEIPPSREMRPTIRETRFDVMRKIESFAPPTPKGPTPSEQTEEG
ncbi:MAG: carbon-nitrogen hydrolase family protein [Methanomassiliicoccales archaeon]|nr:MAG: carbon-nitrogen hydrolase family protein [Methanomassiliicoccales archaeon]